MRVEAGRHHKVAEWWVCGACGWTEMEILAVDHLPGAPHFCVNCLKGFMMKCEVGYFSGVKFIFDDDEVDFPEDDEEIDY